MRLHLISVVVILTHLNCWGDSSQVPPEVLKEVESALLPLFGLKDRPRIQGQVEVPEMIKRLYRIQTKFHMDTASIPLPGLHTQSANTVRSFTHMESPIDGRFRNNHKFRLKFDVSTIPQKEKLKAAELKLTCEVLSQLNETEGDDFQRIVVSDIVKRGVKGVDGPITRVIDSKLIDPGKNATVSVDVLPAVQRWLAEPGTNHGLLIVVYAAGRRKARHVRLRRDADEDEAAWAFKQPILLTYTDDGSNPQRTGDDMKGIRSKRAAKRGHRKGDPCRRRQMYVNFREVGWNDWIVAPLGYDAFYCDGECDYPMADHMNTTNHAIVQSLMNSVRPVDVPKPCCVPTQLSSMSMLYVDSQNKVILKNYKEMVVIGCGCR